MKSLYEADFHAWALDQAGRLRAGLNMEYIDREHIAEELESLGGSEEQQLINRLAVLLAHMLKWEFQPDKRSRSWSATMKEQRKRIARLLSKMPSLRSKLAESIVDAYDIAITFASAEAMIIEEDFPKECPYDLEQIMQGTADEEG
jgi:hypothetical protein